MPLSSTLSIVLLHIFIYVPLSFRDEAKCFNVEVVGCVHVNCGVICKYIHGGHIFLFHNGVLIFLLCPEFFHETLEAGLQPNQLWK